MPRPIVPASAVPTFIAAPEPEVEHDVGARPQRLQGHRDEQPFQYAWTADRTHGALCGSAMTEPPSSRSGRVRVVDGEGHAPARWATLAGQDRRHDVLEAFGRAHLLHPRAQAGVELLQMVAVARQSPHRRAGLDGRPAEHGAVEGPSGLDIVGVQVVEVHRAMLVDRRRAAVRSGLPHAKDRALGIGIPAASR